MNERNRALLKAIVFWVSAVVFLFLTPDFEFLLFQTFPFRASDVLKLTSVLCVILGFMYFRDFLKKK